MAGFENACALDANPSTHPLSDDNVVFATNTSSLSITELQRGAKRPQNVVGMFFVKLFFNYYYSYIQCDSFSFSI